MSTETLPNIRIVLSRTSHPGNLGAAARAMKTMGLSSLCLVRPKRFPDRDAMAMASGALDVFNAAHVCATLDEALAGTTLAFAVTARQREIGHEVLDPGAAAGLAIAEAGQAPVAFVFGNEMSGLTNDEVLRCQRIVSIPANPNYASLNLAAAVQVVGYELWRAASDRTRSVRTAATRPAEHARPAERAGMPAPRAPFEEVEQLYAHFERALSACGYLDPDNPRRFMERLRRLYGRARLERDEVSALRGILSRLEELAEATRGTGQTRRD